MFQPKLHIGLIISDSVLYNDFGPPLKIKQIFVYGGLVGLTAKITPIWLVCVTLCDETQKGLAYFPCPGLISFVCCIF